MYLSFNSCGLIQRRHCLKKTLFLKENIFFNVSEVQMIYFLNTI